MAANLQRLENQNPPNELLVEGHFLSVRVEISLVGPERSPIIGLSRSTVKVKLVFCCCRPKDTALPECVKELAAWRCAMKGWLEGLTSRGL